MRTVKRLALKTFVPLQRQLYSLRDWYTADLAAGAVHTTTAAPGPGGARTVVDTESKLSLSGGKLVFSGGKAAPGYGNPAIWYPAVTRAAGLLLLSTVRPSLTNQVIAIGFDTNQSGIANQAVFNFNAAAAIQFLENGTTGPVVAAYTAGQSGGAAYKLMIALRTTGAFFFICGGAYRNVTLVRKSDIGATATLNPVIQSYSAAAESEGIVIPAGFKWLPVPLASDGYGGVVGTTDGLGHAEGVATGIGAGGGSVARVMSAGTWANGAGVTSCSALAGGLGLDTVTLSTPDVLLSLAVTRTAGSAGLVARYVDADNYIFAYHDGTNCRLYKRVATVETQLVTAVVAYSAGAKLELAVDKDKITLFYNNLRVGTEQTVTDAALFGALKFGLYTTDTGNSFNDFTAYARGAEGQYDWLVQRYLGHPKALVDLFTRADSASLGMSDDGRTWTPTGSNPPQIVSNGMQVPAIDGAGYAYVDFQTTPHIMSGYITFIAGAAADSAVAVLVSSNNYLDRVLDILHFFVSINTWVFQVRVAGGDFVTLDSGTWHGEVATPYYMAMRIEESTVVLTLPDGSEVTITDSRIATVKGRYCFYEIMNAGVATEKQVRFDSVHASF